MWQKIFKGARGMKKPLTISIALVALIAFGLIANSSRSSASHQELPRESKEQPKKVKLAADSLDDKWGEVSFDHENHTLKNYNPDGKTLTACVVCHHTDQPKENLKSPLVTSERNVILTADLLKDAAAGPVKSCRNCHLQAGDDSKPLPVIMKDGKQV